MDRFPPSGEVSKSFSEEAALAASSIHHHDGESFRDEKATVVPFRRAEAAEATGTMPVLPVIALDIPAVTRIPDLGRMTIAATVAWVAPQKNVSLAPDDEERVVGDVLAALDLADLYRLAMADPAAMKKAGEIIGGALDAVAIRRIAVLVLHAEGKSDPGDPIVHRKVMAIVAEIVNAAAAAGKPLIWPAPSAAVADHYRKISCVVTEASHGE